MIVNTRKGIRRRSQLVQTLFCCKLRAFISVLLIFKISLMIRHLLIIKLNLTFDLLIQNVHVSE